MYLYQGPQDARAIANYFLDLAKKENRSIDPMGIQKFVYFAHGWNLALYGRPLIAQRVEAWDYGPVIRDLYQEFKRFGNSPITEPAVGLSLVSGTAILRSAKWEIHPDTPPETLSLLNRVWEVYKPFTSIQLSNMTHAEGTPWKQSRDAGLSGIDDGSIEQYFKAQQAHG